MTTKREPQYAYVSWKYQLPGLKPGERVRCSHTGRDGTVRRVDRECAYYVRVLLDGDKHMGLYHPKDLIYLDRPWIESTCDYYGRQIRWKRGESSGDQLDPYWQPKSEATR